MKRFKVVVNIGHSSTDSGAIGQDGTKEHEFNKNELYPLLKLELEKNGYEVIQIIQNKSFGELPSVINPLNPDVIISLHCNAYNNKASGTEILYWHTSRRSKNLAQFIQVHIVDALKLPNRGIKSLGFLSRGNFLLRKTIAPAVIVESFFIDNQDDLNIARKNLSKLAKGIADGLAAWQESENS